MKPVIIFLFFLFCFSPIFSQVQHKCGTEQVRERQLYSNSAYLTAEEYINEQTSSQISPRSDERITIPVVVHVLYNDEVSNIVAHRIYDQLDIINSAFKNKKKSHFIPEEFEQLRTSSDIFFCLATIDPQGNPTTGITRTKTDIPYIGTATVGPQSEYAVHKTAYGGKDGWNPEKYLNIWVAPMRNGLLGRSSYPASLLADPSLDGVVIDPKFFGTTGSGSVFDENHGLTTIHEIGHYLGLQHIWGRSTGDCSMDDEIDDTPFQDGPYFNCPTHPIISCETPDMFMNFMDYTDDRCLAMFTEGQVNKMRSVLKEIRRELRMEESCFSEPGSEEPEDLEDQIDFQFTSGSDQIIFFFSDNSIQKYGLKMYDLGGRIIYKTQVSDRFVLPIELYKIPAGMYFIRVNTPEQSITKTIIISK